MTRPQTHKSDGTAGVTAEVMQVSPGMAEQWLMRNTHNRPVRQRAVDRLVGIIQRDEWQMNGDAIRFAADGTLLDGQHRLWAILTADKTVPALVIQGLGAATQETMDMGKPRSLRDALLLRGESNSSLVAAALTAKWRYDNGYFAGRTMTPTVAQATDTLDHHPNIRGAAAKAANSLGKIFKLSTSTMAVAIYEMQTTDPEDAEVFIERLRTGADLPEGSPILALRRVLERYSIDSINVAPVMLLALIFKAWNAYRDGEQVLRLTWKASGANPEAFPVLR